jgi:hypothetical protein
MNRTDVYSESGDWIANTVRRKPEALLLLAAGCALLLRGSGASSSKRNTGTNQVSPEYSRESSGTTRRLSRAAEGATEYMADLKDRASDVASSYAASAAEYAEDARQNIAEQSERLGNQAQSVMENIREQPFAVAALGLAAGAAVAALFPSTRVEQQTLGRAQQAIKEAAEQAGNNLMQATSAAGEKLKESAAERGLHPEGMKDLAREVADTFTSTAAGKPQEGSGTAQAQSGPRDSGPQDNAAEAFDLPLDDRRRGGQ